MCPSVANTSLQLVGGEDHEKGMTTCDWTEKSLERIENDQGRQTGTISQGEVPKTIQTQNSFGGGGGGGEGDGLCDVGGVGILLTWVYRTAAISQPRREDK